MTTLIQTMLTTKGAKVNDDKSNMKHAWKKFCILKTFVVDLIFRATPFIVIFSETELMQDSHIINASKDLWHNDELSGPIHFVTYQVL